MTPKVKKLKECQSWKDFEVFVEANGFDHKRTSGGHKQYAKGSSRPIPISTHEERPSPSLRSKVIREILAILGAACFFLMVWHNLSIMS
jgi:predicted RNA binding protein YcfA (HicA-like mRNA interferase family)